MNEPSVFNGPEVRFLGTLTQLSPPGLARILQPDLEDPAKMNV